MERKFKSTELATSCALLACLLLFGCTPTSTIAPAPSSPTGIPLPPTATPDPTSAIIRGLVGAINAKNKDAALAYFNDDPDVYQRDAYFRGHEKVVTWLREDIDGYRDHFDIIEMKTDGAKVSGLFRVISAGSGGFYKASEYLYTFQAVVEGGKIRCLNVGHPRPELC